LGHGCGDGRVIRWVLAPSAGIVPWPGCVCCCGKISGEQGLSG
jgi:hypothetical protein